MTANNPVEQALTNFEINKAMAEQQLARQSAEFGNHEHGRLCFSWRQCHKLGTSIVALSERIPKYDEAIEGLQTGDYVPAISLLDEIIPQLEESPDEVVARVRRSRDMGMVERLQSSPTFMQAGMISLRNELAALMPEDPTR